MLVFFSAQYFPRALGKESSSKMKKGKNLYEPNLLISASVSATTTVIIVKMHTGNAMKSP